MTYTMYINTLQHMLLRYALQQWILTLFPDMKWLLESKRAFYPAIYSSLMPLISNIWVNI